MFSFIAVLINRYIEIYDFPLIFFILVLYRLRHISWNELHSFIGLSLLFFPFFLRWAWKGSSHVFKVVWYMIPINQCERLWSVHPALRKPHCWGKKCPHVFELIVPLDQSLTFLLSLYFSQEKVSKIKTISTHYQPGSVLSMLLKCWSISAWTFL